MMDMILARVSLLPSFVASALLLGATPVSSQQRDPQAPFEPRSSPGAGQKFLDKLAGDWEVAKSLFIRPGAPARMTGTCHQEMINGGRFLRSEFVFDHDGTRATGLGIIGFEPESGKFTSVWTDSRQTRMSLRQSQEPFNGREIVLYGRSLDDERRGPNRSRTVTHLEDDGRKLIHRQYVIREGSKERLIMELVMTRKAGKPGASANGAAPPSR
jgi:hypothetical protein